FLMFSCSCLSLSFFTSSICRCYLLLSFPTRRSSDLCSLHTLSARCLSVWCGTPLVAPNPLPPPRSTSHTALNQSASSIDNNNSEDRKSTRLNSSHVSISYAVFCLNKKYQRSRFSYYY